MADEHWHGEADQLSNACAVSSTDAANISTDCIADSDADSSTNFSTDAGAKRSTDKCPNAVALASADRNTNRCTSFWKEF